MSTPLTPEKALNRVLEIHGDTYDLSKFEYIDTRSKVTLGCKIHGFFEIQFNHITTRKSGCKKCGDIKRAKNSRITFDDTKKEAVKAHNNFYSYDKIIKYSTRKKKYTITCPIHGDFQQSFDAHLAGKGCIKCGHKKTTDVTKSSQEDVLNSFINKHGDIYDYSLVAYKTTIDKVEIICNKHGVFTQKPNNHLQGAGCPSCFGSTSNAEKEIRAFISDKVDITYSRRDILLNKKELYIFVGSKNIAIEYDGIYYHSDLFVENNYHLSKTNDCLNLGINLIHIFEDEWLNKKEIVKSRLLNIIDKTPTRVYARKTDIKEVSSKEAMEFLDKNHLQGKVGANIRLGLYYEKELVSLMTFGNLRKSMGKKQEDGKYE